MVVIDNKFEGFYMDKSIRCELVLTTVEGKPVVVAHRWDKKSGGSQICLSDNEWVVKFVDQLMKKFKEDQK